MVLDAFIPGRLADVRDPTAQELRATGVLRFALDEASLKVRAGGPIDPEEDYAPPVWAGVVPLTLAPGQQAPCERLIGGMEMPGYVRDYDPAARG